ncbi:amino acid ABC transporter permease [Ligilactobacillus sp. WILCCON 0076]|uniref:Amino acid ABC transporter permease n=1 Tax=Ligilactobacillus ubinensis TaxID=2876789 RepID=A0A9X2FKW3_9LACO|nr:amino acid ABC transporter permease [Ligilactobacillus ubinensis]MCP0887240.1 amino acid ABC transporter permease [Ligilactobacillus ubinensis]
MALLEQAYSFVNMRFLFEGLAVTLEVSVISIIFSFIFGLIFGVIRYIEVPYFSAVVGFIIDIIRNLPLLLIIFFTYFAIPELGIRMTPMSASIVALVVFESMMLAEVVRSGIQAVDSGQMEGARANGLTYFQAMRYIILPQALTKMIPPLVSQFISLIKDTSLATIIVLPELLYHAQIVYSQNTTYMLPMYVMIALMYFVVCYILSLAARYLERRLG